jgi:hypothetical protein
MENCLGEVDVRAEDDVELLHRRAVVDVPFEATKIVLVVADRVADLHEDVVRETHPVQRNVAQVLGDGARDWRVRATGRIPVAPGRLGNEPPRHVLGDRRQSGAPIGRVTPAFVAWNDGAARPARAARPRPASADAAVGIGNDAGDLDFDAGGGKYGQKNAPAQAHTRSRIPRMTGRRLRLDGWARRKRWESG